ncbi:helix-turn-helix domain-containing protein [Paraburkholderia antibiotica]|uniref:Helix-turn-helix domain-containing protein n=1 Tax=Paraburkholderia antibiotica TaxID=2728839 RepID=A0A7Y0FGD2_9BURK|nr:helix-turn-helix domain-containing protein [Paraburkholderia antibiotica]NML34909.1 helix-turn-helix domain-containing protein [Paraburkholderia antibiotica]
MNTFGERVRAERERLHMAQADLSKAAGISQSTIAQIEGGRNKGSKHILALARALGVAPEWLETGANHRVVLNLEKVGDQPEDEAPSASVDSTSDDRGMARIRSALRGRTPEEVDRIADALEVLLSGGSAPGRQLSTAEKLDAATEMLKPQGRDRVPSGEIADAGHAASPKPHRKTSHK